jgi:hypothetical protein
VTRIPRYRDGREVAIELHPDTDEDAALLRKAYPHCFPCQYVTVAAPLVLTPVEVSSRWHRRR